MQQIYFIPEKKKGAVAVLYLKVHIDKSIKWILKVKCFLKIIYVNIFLTLTVLNFQF